MVMTSAKPADPSLTRLGDYTKTSTALLHQLDPKIIKFIVWL